MGTKYANSRFWNENYKMCISADGTPVKIFASKFLVVVKHIETRYGTDNLCLLGKLFEKLCKHTSIHTRTHTRWIQMSW